MKEQLIAILRRVEIIQKYFPDNLRESAINDIAEEIEKLYQPKLIEDRSHEITINDGMDDKELAEIRRLHDGCGNCKYGDLSLSESPCNNCKGWNKWELKTE